MSDIGRSVFGQRVSLPDISALALEQELFDYNSGDVFDIKNGDPNYVYIFPIDPRREPKTQLALQAGVYEAVTRSKEPNLITHGQTRFDGDYMFINEHIICRMTKEWWEKRQILRDYQNLTAERRLEETYKENVGRVSGGSVDPQVLISEKTRVATSWE